ncbi:MAG: hypothetical protein F6J87_06575 [Spirulina sp. SIO3F2]|nr:hypothetical protein [Spirulina sp. SIO3F2]
MEIVLLLAALLIAWGVFTWLVKVVKASVQTALGIAVVLVIIQVGFGIGPQQLWQQITNLPQTVFNMLQGS